MNDYEKMQETETMCDMLADKIHGMCNYFRSVFANVPCDISGAKRYSCRVELSLNTEKEYTYYNFEASKLSDLLRLVQDFDTTIEHRFDNDGDYIDENEDEKAYLIKWKNGEAQAITFVHAKTEEGKKALQFAESANEDIYIMLIDDAVEVMMEICHNKTPAALS